MSDIKAVKMPKWGLSMSEGMVSGWLKAEGDAFAKGEDLVEIETSKINNVYEAPFSGTLRKIVAEAGETIPVGGLIAVCAGAAVGDGEVEAFIAEFQATFTPQDDEGDGSDGGMDIRTVDNGGRVYRVGVIGDLDDLSVRPTVLIHGFGGDLNNWLFNAEALAGLGPVVALELPGHGGSSKAVNDGSIEELAEVAIGILQEIGVSKANFIGHSLGGGVALRVALDAPEMVAKLVLLAPVGLPDARLDASFTKDLTEAQTGRKLQPVLARLFANAELATRDMAEDMMKFKRLDGAEEALRKISDRLESGEDLAAIAARLGDVPDAVVIWGASDSIVSPPARGSLPSSWTLHELDCGHMPHMEKAAEVNELIQNALS